MKALSVITINYNNLPGLRSTIASVLKQSFEGIEYIIIDGGSDDGSKELIAEHSTALAYWTSEKDNGVYHAMNKGITKATGEYILFLNSGDYLYSSTVIDNFIKTKPVAPIVYGNLALSNSTIVYPDVLDFSFFFRDSIGHPATFIKRVLFEQYGLYNEGNKIVSDWEFFVKVIIGNKVTAKHLDEIVSYYDMTGISNNWDNVQIQLSERGKVLERYFVEYYPELLNSFNEMDKELNQYKNSRAIGILQKIMQSNLYKKLLGK